MHTCMHMRAHTRICTPSLPVGGDVATWIISIISFLHPVCSFCLLVKVLFKLPSLKVLPFPTNLSIPCRIKFSLTWLLSIPSVSCHSHPTLEACCAAHRCGWSLPPSAAQCTPSCLLCMEHLIFITRPCRQSALAVLPFGRRWSLPPLPPLPLCYLIALSSGYRLVVFVFLCILTASLRSRKCLST